MKKKQLIGWCRTLGTYAVTIDMWTEKLNGIFINFGNYTISLRLDFCYATLRYVDSNFYLHSYCLGCKPYTLTYQIAFNVRKFIDNYLFEYGFSLDQNAFITTDNEPKMVAALSGANRIECADHYVNKIFEHSFTISNSNCAEVIRVFDAIKSLAANFRRSHRQIELSCKLQTFSCSRFNDIYYMLVNFI